MGTHADPMGTLVGAQGATGGRWGSTGPHGEPTGTPLGPKVGYGTSQSYTGPDHANRPRCGAHPRGTLCHIIEIFFQLFQLNCQPRVSRDSRYEAERDGSPREDCAGRPDSQVGAMGCCRWRQ